MNLNGKPTNGIGNTQSITETKKTIRTADMELTDDELDIVAGGSAPGEITQWQGYKVTHNLYLCPHCGKEQDGLDHMAPPTLIDGVYGELLLCNFCSQGYAYVKQ